MKSIALLLCSLTILTSCTINEPTTTDDISLDTSTVPTTLVTPTVTAKPPQTTAIVLPVDQYGQRKTLKVFGEYIQDRFTGYHVADDIEFTDTDDVVPVKAMAEGQVEVVQFISGYGGFIRIKHTIDDQTIHSLYGHISLPSAVVKVGDQVKAGQFLANLGQGFSTETDGERKHLHFGLYAGTDTRLNGYETSAAAVSKWINPQDFFTQHQVVVNHPDRLFSSSDIGAKDFPLTFAIPKDWEAEYIPSRKAINLFTLSGPGTARSRSQIYISFFDADQFQTLTTVNVLSTKEQEIGQDAYVAKRYEIEKKTTAANFADQPSWRNTKHIVTDLRAKEGQTRYFAFAKNPTLDEASYQQILASIKLN